MRATGHIVLRCIGCGAPNYLRNCCAMRLCEARSPPQAWRNRTPLHALVLFAGSSTRALKRYTLTHNIIT